MNLDNYIDVATRRRMAQDLWPDLRIIEGPIEVLQVGPDLFISVTVTVHRAPDDPMPTRATAWEPYPGKTPYTRGSEMMNCATSALGRALGYAGIGIGPSMASKDEVAIRVAERQQEPPKEPTRAPERQPKAKPAKAGKEATQPQLTKINVLLTELVIMPREEKLAKVAGLIGRPIESSKELTADEASTVIDALTKEAELARAVELLGTMLPVEEVAE